MDYNIDYFIAKFEAIPSQKIIAHAQYDDDGNHCAMGWCINNNGFYGNALISTSEEAKALQSILLSGGIQPISFKNNLHGWVIADINNGEHPDFQQLTPKARILAALQFLKEQSAIDETKAIIDQPAKLEPVA